MEETKVETNSTNTEIKDVNTAQMQPKANNSSQQIAAAIVIAGLIIAGAILLKDKNSTPTVVGANGKPLLTSAKTFSQCLDSGKYLQAVNDSIAEARTAGVNGTPKGYIMTGGKVVSTIDGAQPSSVVTPLIDKALAGGQKDQKVTIAPVSPQDRVQGNPDAKVTVILYEDFQCPFCGRFFTDSEKIIRDKYVADGSVLLVYRDFPFLGPESTQAAQAARCAGEQGKFWEYHDYLFTHQNGENQGNFGDAYLKSFAGELKLK